jgi:ABC-type multidrug transport system ATPase subunit
LKVAGIRKAFGENEVLHGVDLRVQRGDRLVIMGPNGIGKSTLLRIVMGELQADAGSVEWGHGTRPGYFAQDHHEKMESSDRTAERWLWDFCPDRDRGYVRGELGLMLFSGEAADKKLSALSGGEAARLAFARLAMEQPNVLVLDEPTNHLDLESIEALVAGLQHYEGTLILVSHDRWFVAQLATRVVEISRTAIRDYHGTYDEYVQACGDDHLDADAVVLKARREERKARRTGTGGSDRRTNGTGPRNERAAPPMPADEGARRVRLQQRQSDITDRIEAVERRIADIDRTFAVPGYFADAQPDAVQALQQERSRLEQEAGGLLEEWEAVELELDTLQDSGEVVSS